MKLEKLLDEACPYCGAGTRGIGIDGRHTNGQQFESRTYTCGLILKWSPNFKCEEVRDPCRKSDAYKVRQNDWDTNLDRLLHKLRKMRGEFPEPFMREVKKAFGGISKTPPEH